MQLDVRDEKSFLAPLLFAEEADNISWVHVAPWDTWSHPLYGDTTMTRERAQKMKANFENNVRGHEINTDYEHGVDNSKGTKASGWIRGVDVRDDGLFLGVEFTEGAKKEISDGEWKYLSVEFFDEWEHPQTGQVHEDVLSGGGLTNKPWIKGLLPINFSEAMTFAVWTGAYVNSLPDSCFLYVEPGGTKDSEGKTKPRSKRHLPYKDAGGKIDLPHLRNAIARIPQMKGISQSLKDSLQARARKLLSNQSSEEVMDEVVDQEHSEPGTGEPPEPRQDDPKKDSTYGTRGDSPDIEEELRRELRLSEDDDVLESVKQMYAEVIPLREAAESVKDKKSFAEQYPEQAAKLERLEKKSRESDAKAFAERFATTEIKGGDDEGKYGFSQLVVDKLENLHKLFSENKASTSDVAEVLEAIADNGLVDFSERGSSATSEHGNTSRTSESDDPGQAFAEKVAEIQENDKKAYDEAVRMAAEQFPDMYSEYRKVVEVRR